jgi:putative addiction module component (TIGR02574 family)
MKLADLPEVRALSAVEKLQLVDDLWQEVAHDLGSLEVTQEQKAILDRRWAAFLKDPGCALSLDQFHAALKTRRP